MKEDRITDEVQYRKPRAEMALAAYDFEPNMVIQTSQWDLADDNCDEWTCILSMEDANSHPYRCAFIVRFQPGTSIVTEAYPGDPH